MDARCILFFLLICLLTCSYNTDDLTHSTDDTTTRLVVARYKSVPTFVQPITNLTVPLGREAILQCIVEDLQTFKVAWLRVDTQTILTIYNHVITKNHRISVTHADGISWFLKIRDVKETDRGFYMCQINTDPMKSQMGYLDVVVPPDILDYPTSADMVVREGSNVTLRCAASGSPTPNITWRKEGGELITISNEQEVSNVEGSSLNITQVNRLQMGAYLCIASNGIPPSVSKRIMLIVHFPPTIWIQNQLVGAEDGQSVTLECHSEGYPKSINFWARDNGDIIAQGTKYDTEFIDNTYKIFMKLTIKSVASHDFGAYRCVSKNSLGDTDGTIKLYEILRPTTISKTSMKTTTITTTTTTTTTTATTTTSSTSTSLSRNKAIPTTASRKYLKSKSELMTVNKIPDSLDKNHKTESSEYKKSSEMMIGESGLASTSLHSSANGRTLLQNGVLVAVASIFCMADI